MPPIHTETGRLTQMMGTDESVRESMLWECALQGPGQVVLLTGEESAVWDGLFGRKRREIVGACELLWGGYQTEGRGAPL